ncbi:MAG: hypothetical protein A2W25_12560 [candidate division Zixibacteria bacterium RBG_16_53_22]|nr:MAG: hypothetical protein A2W25_12560 [candidate division Zixibacteria bacterium RBG_16_53_22]
MKLASMIVFSSLVILMAMPSAMAVTWEVEIEDFAFVPGRLRINVGDAIEWRNRDDISHTATSDNGVFNSGLLARDQTFTFLFTEPGVYPYHCTPHPTMRDTITVVGPTGVGDLPVAPREFEIAQNYPNPFNASTTIGFSLPSDGRVTVEIFNLLGQRLVTLVDGEMSAGSHRMIWDAGELQSGVFFYRVGFDGQSRTGRMTLLK